MMQHLKMRTGLGSSRFSWGGATWGFVLAENSMNVNELLICLS